MTASSIGWRHRALRVIVAAWLAIVTTVAVRDHIMLWHRIETRRPGAEQGEIAALVRRITDLRGRLSALQRQPAPVTEIEYGQAKRDEDERLAAIQQSLIGFAPQAALLPITQRLAHLEAEVWHLRHPPRSIREIAHVPAHRAVRIAPGANPSPPFALIGREIRGGMSFLAVAPSGNRNLGQVRLLRPGQTDDGWTLTALRGTTAVFEIAGRKVRLPIP